MLLIAVKLALQYMSLIVHYTTYICNCLCKIGVFVVYRSDHMAPEKILAFVQVGKFQLLEHFIMCTLTFLLMDLY